MLLAVFVTPTGSAQFDRGYCMPLAASGAWETVLQSLDLDATGYVLRNNRVAVPPRGGLWVLCNSDVVFKETLPWGFELQGKAPTWRRPTAVELVALAQRSAEADAYRAPSRACWPGDEGAWVYFGALV